MKKTVFLIAMLLSSSLLFLHNAFTQAGLPEGAKARFGKGYKRAAAFFPTMALGSLYQATLGFGYMMCSPPKKSRYSQIIQENSLCWQPRRMVICLRVRMRT